ncbi:hypothetical protein M0805_004659 [Coniferiporia weirii]|nr:hypothetical protein M0805_004659 [Coniferiporia weirii]
MTEGAGRRGHRMLKGIKALVVRLRTLKAVRLLRTVRGGDKGKAEVESPKSGQASSPTAAQLGTEVPVPSSPSTSSTADRSGEGKDDTYSIKQKATAGYRSELTVISEEDIGAAAEVEEVPSVLEPEKPNGQDEAPAPATNRSAVSGLLEEPIVDPQSGDSVEDAGGDDASTSEGQPSISPEEHLEIAPPVSGPVIIEGLTFEDAALADPNTIDARSSPPARPPRPESPELPEIITERRQPTLSWPLQNFPPSFEHPPVGDRRYRSSHVSGTDAPPPPRPHIRDNTWLVPVHVLSPALYTFEYQFGGLLGEGGFGKVLLALHLRTHAQYAVKVLALRRVRSRREATSVSNEAKVLWKVWRAGREEAPFLARPASVKDWIWQYRGNIHMVLEYYQGGDLGRGANRHPELRDPRQFKLMVAEVIALLGLHDMGIVHHDVKPTNILVDAEGHCILADYGGSCFLSESPGTPGSPLPTTKSPWVGGLTPIFTVRYAAPEVLTHGFPRQNNGASSDFWSLGITLFELATGRDLVDEADDDEAILAIQRDEIDREQLVLLSAYPGLRQFVSALLVEDPVQRLQGHNVKAHAYFAEFTQSDWTAIFMKGRPPFLPNKQHPVNPRNTSYDVIERPGENLLDDANEDIVCRWLAEDGVGLPHHRASDFYQRHRNNARVGLPERAQRMEEEAQREMGEVSVWSKSV